MASLYSCVQGEGEAHLHELHSDELEAALFESLDDVANESALDSVGLHHDESAVRVRHGRLRMRVIKSKHKMISENQRI